MHEGGVNDSEGAVLVITSGLTMSLSSDIVTEIEVEMSNLNKDTQSV